MILDANGEPIDLQDDLPQAQRDAQQPQTESDPARLAWLQQRFEDHPSRGLTPDRLHALLVAAEQGDLAGQLDLCEDMEERDGHMAAEMAKRVGAVAALPWSVVSPTNPSAEEQSQTAQVTDWLGGIDELDDLVRWLMSAVLRGFACVELGYELESDGSGRKVLLPEMSLRPHAWFTVDGKTRSRLGLRQQGVPDGEPLREVNWISHLHRAKNGLLPRAGLVRTLAWPYLFGAYATGDLAELLKIWGIPPRIGRYPSGATKDEKAALLRAVVQLGHRAAGIMPAGMQLELLKAAEGSNAPFDSMLDRMEAIKSKVILGQTLTAGEGKHGTQALGAVHNDVRMDIRADDARQISATVTRQLIAPLVLLNIPGANPARLPRFVLDATEADDLARYADALPKLVGVGFKIDRKWAQDRLRVPEPADGADALAVAATAPATPPARPAATAAPAALAAAPPPAPRDQVDALVDDMLSDWRPLMAPMVEPLLAELRNAIAAGESAQQFAARLPELLERMDATPLGERISRGSFVARLAGESNLDL